MSFDGSEVVHGVDLTIGAGEFFTLLGPSGCGKSTTLNAVAGLTRPASGRISIGETVLFDSDRRIDLEPENRNVGMVFQSYALWPQKTVEQNVLFPLTVRKVDARSARGLVRDALDRVGLADYARRFPHELSGGQQQRVALARALVHSPTVLLLDEPLSNLDAKLRVQARNWLKELQSEVGITTIYVTHDQDEALSLSDRIGVMFDGNLAQVAAPEEIYERPSSLAVAGFIGSAGFISAEVLEAGSGEVCTVRPAGTEVSIRVRSGSALRAGDPVAVAIRPERIRVAASGAVRAGENQLEGRVASSSYLGSRHELSVSVGESTVVAYSTEPRPEAMLSLRFRVDDAIAFAR